MRKKIVIAWLGALFLGIIVIFWHNEWVYSLPTPVPAGYKTVATGTLIKTAALLPDTKKPVFIHFFNPDCPCSRFNVPYFKKLVAQYQHEVDFVVVPVSNEPLTEEGIRKRFSLDVPIRFDTSLAATCGVYSTPQAVIIDANRSLYYRGNYNKSRYCTDPKTNYAEIALQALLHQQATVSFGPYALQAYGCQLPVCKQ